VCYGLEYGGWRSLQQVRETHLKSSVAHFDGVVHAGEGIKLDANLGYGRVWPQLPITSLEEFLKIGPQDFFTLSRTAQAQH